MILSIGERKNGMLPDCFIVDGDMAFLEMILLDAFYSQT